MTTNNNKGIEGWTRHYRDDKGIWEDTCPHGIGHEEGVHGCDGCCKGLYYTPPSPLTMEEKWEERFDEYFYDADHSLKPSQIAHIKKYLITDLISSAVTQALEEQRGETLEEIDIMLAEEPSNYPTPQGQEAVYGVLERLKERLLSNNK